MIKSLTSLRGIFILFIFFHHCMNLYPGGGTMAVTFFFVLGGFSMTLGYRDRVLQSEFSYKKYLLRRCIKFYPLHWICLLAALPLTLLPFSMQKGFVLFMNAALMHTLILGRMYFSFNSVSWYLADTMFFAVLFPSLLKGIVKSTKKGRTFIAITIMSLYTIIAFLLPQSAYHSILYISPYIRVVDFIFGIYLALGYLSIKDIVREQKKIKVGEELLLTIVFFSFIVFLIVESCLLPKPVQYISIVYWPCVALLILFSSLLDKSSLTIMGGGIFEKQVATIFRQAEFYDFPYTPISHTVFKASI